MLSSNRHTSSTCPHNMTNCGLLTAEIGSDGSGVWVTPANFNRFRVLASLLQAAATSLTGGQPNFARCLAISWAGTRYIHFRQLLAPDGILPGAKFCQVRSGQVKITSKSCVLLYWRCYCTALQQRASVRLCGVVQGMELPNFCRGRHLYSAGRPSLGHRPTFYTVSHKTSHLYNLLSYI